jgi:hypothetical protein
MIDTIKRFAKSLGNKRRYFIVRYLFVNKGGWGCGEFGVSADTYPNKEYLITWLHENKDCNGAAITGIEELTKRDYDAYFSEAE